MNKLFSTVLILLSGLNFSFAQQAKPKAEVNFQNFSQLQTLPKHTRDSLVTAFKTAGNAMKNTPSFKINDKDMSGELASTTKKLYKSMTELMIEVLENPNPELTAKNQVKFNKLQHKMEYDMNILAEKMSYEEERKDIIEKYKSGQYDDAKERRDARKEMNESLKDLKKDYNENMKEHRQEKKENEQEENEA